MEVNNITIPLTYIGGSSIPRLILGHLPFVGESYQGNKKNKEYIQKFSQVENTVKIVVKAINEYGVTAMAVASATECRLSSLLLVAVREVIAVTGTKLTLLPCFKIPLMVSEKPVDDYKRWVTYYKYELKKVEGLLRKYVNDPILRCRRGWAKKFPEALDQGASYSRDEVKSLRIDYSGLETAIGSFSKYRIRFAEAGSESDFLTMTGRFDLLRDVISFLRRKLGCPILLGIHHAGTSIPLLEEKDVGNIGYITPVNNLGALMLPSKRSALMAIQASKKPIIAIKPLAGGRIPPETAFKYVFNEVKVNASMVGVASETEVDETFQTALNSLS